jgi:hypothetical protein
VRNPDDGGGVMLHVDTVGWRLIGRIFRFLERIRCNNMESELVETMLGAAYPMEREV